MRTRPTVSVLLTSYNRERYIAASIASVLSQTFGDFELVVVDDHSSDRTVDVARSFLSDPRVRLIQNERNLGDYPNRNHAATFARGAFLKYHDSDDIMYPHCLGTMVAPLMAEPRAGFALSGSRHWPGGPCPMLLTPRLAYQREFLGSGLFHLGPSCAMFRAEVFRELGGFPHAGVASDYLFWNRACARTNVLLVPGDLFYYRVHPDQELSSPRSTIEYARASGTAWTTLNSSECPLQDDERLQARRNLTYLVARSAFRHLKVGRFRSAAAVARYSQLGVIDWLRYLRPPRRDPNAGTPPPDRAQGS